MRLQATGTAINSATSRDGGAGFEALTPTEVTNIGTTAKAELGQLTKPREQTEWKQEFHQKMTELASKPENGGVRGQIDKMLKGLGCPGLGEAAPAQGGWQAGRNRTTGAREVTGVQGPQLSELPKAPSITGNVELKEGKAFITTESGKRMELVQGNNNINPPLYPSWALSSFADDGPVTVRGTLGSDGKFQVLDAAPGTSTQFTYGRVNEADINTGKVVLKTARGDVEVTNPELKEVLLRAPRLGIILPGDPKVMPDGKMVYDQNPPAYYGLGGRAREVPQGPERHTQYTAKVPGKEGVYVAHEDMAYSFFSNKPVYMDDNSAQRLDYNVRSMMLGRLKLSDDKSTLESFDAHYVGKNPENRSFPSPESTATALPNDQAASMLGAQGFSQAARPGIDGFMWRNKPPEPPPAAGGSPIGPPQ
jgi:hypothetical protein